MCQKQFKHVNKGKDLNLSYSNFGFALTNWNVKSNSTITYKYVNDDQLNQLD